MQSNNTKFYLARAAEARVLFKTEPLANVRDRLLRSAEAWEAMAARSTRADESRAMAGN